MFKLSRSNVAWGSAGFEQVFKEEVQGRKHLLPLQSGLLQSSHVSESDISVIVLAASDCSDTISIKTGIFYSGIIAGSCCADDPTPVCEQSEYCELQFVINKQSSDAVVTLLSG